MRILRYVISMRVNPMRQKSILSFFGKNPDEPIQDSLPITKVNSKKPECSKPIHRICKVNSLPSEAEIIECGNESTVVTLENYDPSKKGYHAVKDACWAKGQNVPFRALCFTFMIIEGTSSRLKIISILTNYFHSILRLSPHDMVPSIYLCLNQIGPSYEGKELGIGESSLISVLGDCTGKKTDEIKQAMNKFSDLGVLAENFKTSQNTMIKHKPLAISDVFNRLRDIGSTSGQSSNTHKKNIMRGLIAASSGCETRYLVRSLQKKLRIGLAEQSILVAIAHAFAYYSATIDTIPAKEELDIAALTVKTAFSELPNYDIVIDALFTSGLKNLHVTCKMQPGIPVKPMLANSSKSITEILKRFEEDEISCEHKYDGERAQIHCNDKGVVSIFSRNQEDSTMKFPDIVELMSTILKDQGVSFIIDSEVVAYDVVNSKILPFQQLTTRKRKNVDQSLIKIQVCIFVFDILYLNGVSLVQEIYRKRRQILHETFHEIPGKLMFATYNDVCGTDEIQQALDDAIKSNCEGLIIKTLDNKATYEIAKRSHSWRKLKKDYLDSIGDSFDLVVLGGYIGVGKRSGFYGGYLLACYNPDEEEYPSICKIGTGFTDEDLKSQFDYFSKHIIPQPKPSYKVAEALTPYHWFDCTTVWEVRAADISLSPIHQAALGKLQPDKGISLRFPRFVRVRTDKSSEQATDIYQVIDMYKNQEKTTQLSQVDTPSSQE